MNATMKRLKGDDSGLSLTELLVSAMVTLVILLFLGNLFISVANTTASSNQNRTTNDAASNIANEVTNAVRVSTDLVKSDGTPDPAVLDGSTRNTLIVYSLSTLTNSTATTIAPSKVTFTLAAVKTGDPLSVVETRCAGTASGTTWTFSSACTKLNLGLGVVAASTTATGPTDQLFTYYDGNGAQLNPSVIDGKLSATQRDAVASIVVYVKVKGSGTKAPVSIISNKVVLRNLGLDTTP